MGRYWKAINAALLAGLTSAGVALVDGHITAAEWVAIAVASLGTSGGVAITSNAPSEPTVLQDVKDTLNEHAAVLTAHADALDQLQPVGANPPSALHPLPAMPDTPKAKPSPSRKRDARGHFAKES